MSEFEVFLFREIVKTLEKFSKKYGWPNDIIRTRLATDLAIGLAPKLGAYFNGLLNKFTKELAHVEFKP
jgi:hypothetical protein